MSNNNPVVTDESLKLPNDDELFGTSTDNDEAVLDEEDTGDEHLEATDVINKSELPLTNKNVTIKSQCIKPTEQTFESTDDIITDAVSLPDVLEKDGGLANNLLQLYAFTDEEPVNLWSARLYQSLTYRYMGDALTPALGKGKWSQSLEVDGVTFKPSKPRFTAPSKDEKLSAARGSMEIDRLFGTGSYFTIPLVHTGIWVQLKPPANFATIELDEKLKLEKNEHGKRTIGMVFSNHKTYIHKHLMEFFVEHIHDCSITDWEGMDSYELLDLIKMNDIPLIAAALGYVLYPHGFKYVVACGADNNCEHIRTAILNIGNCIWFNRSVFSKTQKLFMSDRAAKRSIDEIKKYQEENEIENNFYDTGEGLKIYFTMPSVAKHIERGETWLNEIQDAIDSAFGRGITQSQIESFMTKRFSLSLLRQYSHFIRTIQFTESGAYIDGGEEIDKILTKLSGIREVVNNTLEHVGEFINDNTKAMVAIPRSKCPGCDNVSTEGMHTHPYLIPIDSVNLFFTLGNLKSQFGSRN